MNIKQRLRAKASAADSSYRATLHKEREMYRKAERGRYRDLVNGIGLALVLAWSIVSGIILCAM
jgi:hypothetical protein